MINYILSYEEFVSRFIVGKPELSYNHILTYIGTTKSYELFIVENSILYKCFINQNSDIDAISDYESKYASNANTINIIPIAIYDKDSNGITSTSTGINKRALDVHVGETIDVIISSSGNVPVIITNESVNVTIVDSKLIKFAFDFNSTSKSCNSSTWTEFYNIDFSPNEVLFQELIIKSDNSHLIKITIDDQIILSDVDISILESFISPTGSDNHNTRSNFIGAIKKGNDYHLKFNLDGSKGASLRVYQKRVSGSGNLTLEGYILTYKEDI